MNPGEQNQTDAWIVRVLGKEYGPVDLDELREWKREGRLIRENEIREARKRAVDSSRANFRNFSETKKSRRR